MKRKCCLCGDEPQEFERKNWKITSVGERPIAFGVCKSCGLVQQTETLSINDMNAYYRDVATYINPGRAGKPAPNKVRGLDRATRMVKDVFQKVPKSVFQVGASDGYTLSRFKDLGADQVLGIDLSEASCELARERYGVDMVVGDFEGYEADGETFELIVLTHVLEHLFDPGAMLSKCADLQEDGGAMLIEVPLMDRIDCFPPGIFCLEHLNYFSENALDQLIRCNGYDVLHIAKDYVIGNYPIITMYCVRQEVARAHNAFAPDPIVESLVDAYMRREHAAWSHAESRIHAVIPKGGKIYVYGAGLHTTQLLANTDIEDYAEIMGVLDSSPTKWGHKLGPYDCLNPEDAEHDILGVVISSYNSENEIYKAIQGKYGDATIVTLYDQ